MTIPIVLAEPHPVARAALTTLLEEDGGLEVVPIADLADALRAVARRRAPVLIVSRGLLERGPEGARLPGAASWPTRTIVLGLEEDPAFAVDARRAGAASYVLKDRADRRPARRRSTPCSTRPALRTTWPLSA